MTDIFFEMAVRVHAWQLWDCMVCCAVTHSTYATHKTPPLLTCRLSPCNAWCLCSKQCKGAHYTWASQSGMRTARYAGWCNGGSSFCCTPGHQNCVIRCSTADQESAGLFAIFHLGPQPSRSCRQFFDPQVMVSSRPPGRPLQCATLTLWKPVYKPHLHAEMPVSHLCTSSPIQGQLPCQCIVQG